MRSETPAGKSAMLSSEHRNFLTRIALYTFFLFCLIPFVLGIAVPLFLESEGNAFDGLIPRISYLIATGGASFLIAYLPALALWHPGILRRLYEFALFPLAVVCTAAQIIMFAEFGTEITDRLLGLFEGNAPALWVFACEKYSLDWAIGGLLIVSAALATWLRYCRRAFWKPNLPFGIGAGFLVIASAAIALGLDHNLRSTAFYHPAKMSGAPLFQVIVFIGEQMLFKRSTGVREILASTAKIQHEDTKTEIAARLGESPESFLRKTIQRPNWLKKTPSHVFLFVMESMNYDFTENPALQPVAPRLHEFSKSGISIPNFYAGSEATIDAIQSGFSGVNIQGRYPDANILAKIKIDSLPRIMKHAGYTPLFYAASHRKFGNKGDSCEAYGFDRFVGLPDLHPEKANNEWGVHDGPFFRWAREDLELTKGPKFVGFLNVSFHAPYDAPATELGDSKELLSPEILQYFYGKSDEEKLLYATHASYADREIGEMVDSLVKQYPDALFCLFGDHCGPKLRNQDHQQVPFILWNDAVIDSSAKSEGWFGSHMDIPATLANLVLPDGEKIITGGAPLWSTPFDRLSLAGSSVLSNSGYWNEDGSPQITFLPNTKELAKRLSQPLVLKASAIQSLFWALSYDQVDFLSLDIPNLSPR